MGLIPRWWRSSREEADRIASDADQTASESDQTDSDTDQTLSDRDQVAAEADQRVSDRDQAAADLEFETTPPKDPKRTRAHEEAQVARGESTIARAATGVVRTLIGGEREAHADRRDEIARGRDATADARDAEAEIADRVAEEMLETTHGLDPQAAEALETSAGVRKRAAEARARAATDRRRAANDREAAARDRRLLQAEVQRSHLDELTGAYRRGMGEILLRHEIERARRSDGVLTFVFVDVDKLKETNDSRGHVAGDALLRDVFASLQARLRPYDPIVRWGGDEFVCPIAGITLEEAKRRIEGAQTDLGELRPGASISTGFATLRQSDTLATLVERADAALLEGRKR